MSVHEQHEDEFNGHNKEAIYRIAAFLRDNPDVNEDEFISYLAFGIKFLRGGGDKSKF